MTSQSAVWMKGSVTSIEVLKKLCFAAFLKWRDLCFYRPQTKFAKVMFSQVSVCPQGGVYPITCWDTHTPGPKADTPQADTPPGQTPPWADTTPGRHHPRHTPPWADNPCIVHAGIWSTSGQYASTGMHSCYQKLYNTFTIIFQWISNSFNLALCDVIFLKAYLYQRVACSIDDISPVFTAQTLLYSVSTRLGNPYSKFFRQ